MSGKRIVLIICDEYPPYGGAADRPVQLAKALEGEGHSVEIIAESDNGEEFIHLDGAGNLVHRVSGDRSHGLRLLRALGKPFGRGFADQDLAFAARVAEKVLELVHLWGREILWVEATSRRAQSLPLNWLLGHQGRRTAPDLGLQAEATGGQRAPPAAPVRSVDLVIPSFDRFDELKVSLGSIVEEVDRARRRGLDCSATIVYQNEGLPERLYAWRPDLRPNGALRLVFSSPPSLTRARNAGLRATSGDLVVFVDDDVTLEPGFVAAHCAAADAHPGAIGVAGRIVTRHDHRVLNVSREVGQIRVSGREDCNYNSSANGVALVPQTPMGANMAYRRRAMNALFGESWFDERFVGSAFREESMLALRIFRMGAHLVFAPKATLYHFESVDGGCNNRGRRTLRQRINHDGLDDLFLMELYDGVPWLQWAAPALRSARDIAASDRLKTMLAKGYIHAGGFLLARRLRRERSVGRR